ncbi:hypothetical protein GIB67_016681 [Kingdonia uniflora]|uniref:Uncharacterized protein n=1 Tax=Kingdonia uniflora TaxID=39325 RepID=A0A7J7MEH5_9MAGN|nr:hypothetical protein GIB67_016681 [Kingdonia uniflora]
MSTRESSLKIGAVEALVKLLSEGSSRGKKDAVTTLFNFSTHSDSCKRMIEVGVMIALLVALGSEGVAEEAASALALLVRQPIGAEHVAKEEMEVTRLINMMRRGTPKVKENVVAALLELCRGSGALATQRVLRVPALASLLQTLLFTGTKRARRKAASLAWVCQRCEAAVTPMEAVGAAYRFPGNSMATFVYDVSMAPVSISVPVL